MQSTLNPFTPKLLPVTRPLLSSGVVQWPKHTKINGFRDIITQPPYVETAWKKFKGEFSVIGPM